MAMRVTARHPPSAGLTRPKGRSSETAGHIGFAPCGGESSRSPRCSPCSPRRQRRSPPRRLPRRDPPHDRRLPHVKARDYGSLGFGYGYAYAQDQICELRRHHGHRQRAALALLRRDASRPRRHNLESDFFCQRIKDAGRSSGWSRSSAPHGPAKTCAQNVKGFAAGYNAYLRKTGRAKLPDPTCRGKALGAPDHAARRLPPLLPARPARQLGQLPRARSSTPRRPRGAAAAAPRGRRRARERARDDRARRSARWAPTPTASARDGTRGGRSLRARQPALPVAGLRALVRAAPDDPRQARRDRRRRCRACRSSTSASTATSRGATRSRPRAASRRTSSSSCPATRPSYLVDGKAVKMRRRTVRVRVRVGGAQRAHVLRDALGAGVRASRRPALTWTARHAYALADVNADNFRLTNQWVEYDRAHSVARPAPRVREGAGQPVGQRDRGRLRRPRLLRRRRRSCRTSTPPSSSAARRRRRRRCC